MTLAELQKLREAGYTVDQIAELDTKLTRCVGFRALVHMMTVLQFYDTPFSEVQEAWRLATVTRGTQ
jgi:hypothetical protein